MDRRLHIAFLVTNSKPLGGSHIHVRDLAQGLTSEGHRVTVMSGGSGQLPAQLSDRGIAHLTVPHLDRPIRPLGDLRALKALRQRLASLQPDLLSTHSSKAGVLGRLAADRLELPVIFTAHGWAFTPGVPTTRRLLYQVIERLVSQKASHIITVSEHDRRLALEQLRIDPERITAIPNGMPDVPTTPRAAPNMGEPRLVMVGRFLPQKDHETLIRALVGLRHRPWTLDLVGDGPRLGKVDSMVRAVGLQDRVRFLGERNDVERVLAGSSIFVLSSLWEGLPRSIIEAMRAGLPVVAARVGGVAELVQDQETGLLVEPKRADELERAIDFLLTNPAERCKMGVQARQRYAQRFAFERMLNETKRVYERVVPIPRGLHGNHT